jgi:hypothetical protein
LDSRGVRLYWYFEPYTLRNKNAWFLKYKT